MTDSTAPKSSIDWLKESLQSMGFGPKAIKEVFCMISSLKDEVYGRDRSNDLSDEDLVRALRERGQPSIDLSPGDAVCAQAADRIIEMLRIQHCLMEKIQAMKNIVQEMDRRLKQPQ